MAVLTIFNHGTGFNREKSETATEVVGKLSQLIAGTEARHESINHADTFILNEGPGATSGTTPMPSDVDWRTGTTKKRVKLPGFGTVRSKSANIYGSGWGKNVKRTMFLIDQLQEQGKNITIINMVGWSRGAVTSIRIANALQKEYPDQFAVNMFAVDPVAGLQAGNSMEDTKTIPRMVKHYVAVLAMHETRKTFKPQDMSRVIVEDRDSTEMVYLPLPGQHNAQVTTKSNVNGSPEYDITMSLAWAFLRNFGTTFTGPPPGAIVTNADMCKKYAMCLGAMGRRDYKTSSGLSKRVAGMGRFGQRSFVKKHLSSYVSGGAESYWVNEHHRKCFQAAFPQTYNAVFRNQPRTGRGIAIPPNEVAAMGGGMAGLVIGTLVDRDFLFHENRQVYAVPGAGVTVHATGNAWPLDFPKHA